MRAYVLTTGTLSALLVVAHVWRVVVDGPVLAKNPWFLLTTAISVVLTVWAVRIVRRLPRA